MGGIGINEIVARAANVITQDVTTSRPYTLLSRLVASTGVQPLAEWRERAGWSQHELAQRVGTDKSVICKWECHLQNDGSARVVAQICAHLSRKLGIIITTANIEEFKHLGVVFSGYPEQ